MTFKEEMMKELAIVRLTKSLVVKVGEKVTKKREEWAEAAALSKEENKRREEEFKKDFKGLKEKISQTTAKAKEEVQKGVEATSKTASTDKVKIAQEKAEKAYLAVKEKAGVVEKEPKSSRSNSVASSEKKAPAKKRATKSTPKAETTAKESTKKSAKKEVKKESTKKRAVKTAAKEAKPTKTASEKKASGSKRAAKIALYSADITKHYGSVDEAFLEIVVKNLGPSIYRKDAELVSCSDPKELDTVRKNFLIKKLGLKESDEVLNGAIKEVCEELKASRNKYRATFYYALAKKLKQESKLS
jgi:hypothetical protein